MNRRSWPLLALLLLTSACAWTRRENRPVWVVFEDHLVPEDRTAFALALPLTVPLGVLAILTDTFVAHPLQVVDDAGDDAAEPWRNLTFDKAYYTRAASVPVRAIGTPLIFVGSFLGRSMFDIRSNEEAAVDRDQRAEQRQKEFVAWLRSVAAGSEKGFVGAVPRPFDDEIREAIAAAVQGATPLGRRRLYHELLGAFWVGEQIDWNTALSDPSAVVRFEILDRLPSKFEIAPEVQERLLVDPDPVVRAAVERRFRK
jgi:hypothetical protein